MSHKCMSFLMLSQKNEGNGKSLRMASFQAVISNYNSISERAFQSIIEKRWKSLELLNKMLNFYPKKKKECGMIERVKNIWY